MLYIKTRKMTFSKISSILSFILLLSFSGAASAQSGQPVVTDVTTGLLGWIKHLNADVNKYFFREKAAALDQQLGLLKDDLSLYMKTRKSLADSLFRHNVAPGKVNGNALEQLQTRMTVVMQKMRDVTDLVGTELQAEGDRLNNDIYDALFGEKKRFLSHLEAFLAGYDVTKKDLALDNSAGYSRLEECIGQITALQDKIRKKMK